MTMTTSTTTTPIFAASTPSSPPTVRITALPIIIDKVEVFGVAAFMELGLARGNVKYFLDKGRLRYDLVYKLAGYFDASSLIRTYRKASNQDLNFLDEEIPKFICWYGWDVETQSEACWFLKNVVIKGLESLKKVYETDDKKDVLERLAYWINIIHLAIVEPVTKDHYIILLNGLKTDQPNAAKVDITLNNINGSDFGLGPVVKSLITKVQLEQINALFKYQFPSEDKRVACIESNIENLYFHFEQRQNFAKLQRLSYSETQQFLMQSPPTLPTQISESPKSSNDNPKPDTDTPTSGPNSNASSPSNKANYKNKEKN